MNIRKLKNQSFAILFLFLGFSVNAQNGENILGFVDDTEQFKTVELAHMDRELSTFVNLVHLSGLATSLEFTEEHTVFIPTNEAFGKMSIERFAELTNPQNRDKLMDFVRNHVVSAKVMTEEFEEMQVIDSAGDKEIAVSVGANGGPIFIGGAEIIKGNISGSNGVIHIVDNIVEAESDIVE